jgi:hypothetical protein
MTNVTLCQSLVLHSDLPLLTRALEGTETAVPANLEARTCRPVARERLGKQVRNNDATNNRVDPFPCNARNNRTGVAIGVFYVISHVSIDRQRMCFLCCGPTWGYLTRSQVRIVTGKCPVRRRWQCARQWFVNCCNQLYRGPKSQS